MNTGSMYQPLRTARCRYHNDECGASSSGPKGPTGATGATGFRGVAGRSGPRGFPGAKGLPGVPGRRGTGPLQPGLQGLRGPRGRPGFTGSTGMEFVCAIKLFEQCDQHTANCEVQHYMLVNFAFCLYFSCLYFNTDTNADPVYTLWQWTTFHIIE